MNDRTMIAVMAMQMTIANRIIEDQDSCKTR